MNDLEGQTAIVTGAAHGIGRAIAMELAGRGAVVAVLDLDEPAAVSVVDDVGRAGGTALAVRVDLTRPDEVESAVQDVATRHQGVHLLVNNAGLMDSLMTPITVTLEEWDRVMAVNVTASFLTCKHVLPLMLDQGGGAIVNIASIAGVRGGRAGAAYTASKHAVVGLTRNIAWAYADAGIRCNAVCPGGVATDIKSRQLGNAADERGNRRYRAAHHMKPPSAETDDIAAVVGFLASDRARFVNGAVLPADGGWLEG